VKNFNITSGKKIITSDKFFFTSDKKIGRRGEKNELGEILIIGGEFNKTFAI
jgi:hypothetical protein